MKSTRFYRIVLYLLVLSNLPELADAFDRFGCEDPEYRVVKLAINKAGTPWVLARKVLSDIHHNYDYRLLYYKDQQLIPCTPPISFNGSIGTCNLYGGRDRDAWLAYRRGEQNGCLINLGTDKTERQITFISDSRDREPEIYVAKDGRVINWGASFLAVFGQTGQWQRREANLPHNDCRNPPLIFEINNRVYCFVTPYLYITEPGGKTKEIKIKGAPEVAKQSSAFRWGTDKIVVWYSGFNEREPHAFDIFSGNPVVFPKFEGKRHLRAAIFSTKDGTLWFNDDIYRSHTDVERRTALLAPGASQYTLCKGLRCPERNCTIGFDLTEILFERKDGLIISGEDGITLIDQSGSTKKYGADYGLTGVASDIHEDHKDNLWFVMNGKLCNIADPSRHTPKQITSPWEEFEIQPGTWLFQPAPGEIAYFAKGKSLLKKWDGYKWSEQAMPITPVDATAYDNAFTGGTFSYPPQKKGSFNNAPVYRDIGNEKMRMRLDASPLPDAFPMSICEDKAGNVWFLAALPFNIRTFETPSGGIGMRSDDLRLFKFTPANLPDSLLMNPPKSCERALVQRLNTSGFESTPTIFGRVGSDNWRKFDHATNELLFLFPSNGTYTCELCAFDNGIRFKGSRSFSITATVQLPDTRITEAANNTLCLDSRDWLPPVSIVPTTAQRIWPSSIEWKEADTPLWQSLPLSGIMKTADFDNGAHTFLFRAVENEIWRDPTPVRLSVQIQLSMDERLLAAVEVLNGSNQTPRKEKALNFARNNKKAITRRLAELQEQANDLRLVEYGEQLYRIMQTEGSNIRNTPNGIFREISPFSRSSEPMERSEL